MAIFIELAKPWYLAWVFAYVRENCKDVCVLSNMEPVCGIPNIPGC